MSKELDAAQQVLMDNLSNLFSDFKSNFRDNVSKFLSEINEKWQTIVVKFDEQHSELERVRKELNSKTFDESNYTNVSLIKKQDNTIKEHMNKIRELENRIKSLEKELVVANGLNKVSGKQGVANATSAIKLNDVDDKDMNEIIGVVSKEQPKEEEDMLPASVIKEALAVSGLDKQEDNLVTPAKKTRVRIARKDSKKDEESEQKPARGKKASAKAEIKAAAGNLSGPTINEGDEAIAAVANEEAAVVDLDEQQKAINKAMKEKREKELQKERELMEMEARMREEKLRKEQEEESEGRDEDLAVVDDEGDAEKDEEAPAPAPQPIKNTVSKMKPAIEETKKKKTEIKKKEPAAKEDKKTASKDSNSTNKSKKEEKVVEKVAEKTVEEEMPQQVEIPSVFPTSVEDVETLEYNNEMFYMDNNKNVYQMTADEDIGVFLGVYNEKLNKIMPYKKGN